MVVMHQFDMALVTPTHVQVQPPIVMGEVWWNDETWEWLLPMLEV